MNEVTKGKKKREWRKGLFALIRPAVRLVARVFFGASTKVYRHIEGPYLVIGNHTYIADAMLMGAAFREPLHIVAASATLASSGWGRVVRFLADPIPVDKAGMDVKGIKRMLSEARAGHSIGLFPEGNITIDGSPLPFDRAVAKLAKQLRLKVVLYRIERGYLKKPKWAECKRKGRVCGSVTDVIEVDEVAALSVDELYERIRRGIDYDVVAAQKAAPVAFPAKRLAAGIERLLYYCPECGEKGDFQIEKDDFRCAHCGHMYHVDEYGFIENAPFDNTEDWNRWQLARVRKEEAVETFGVEGKLVHVGEKNVVGVGLLAATETGVGIGGRAAAYDEIEGVVLHDCNNLLLTVGGEEYRFVPDDRHANVMPLLTVIEDRIGKRQ